MYKCCGHYTMSTTQIESFLLKLEACNLDIVHSLLKGKGEGYVFMPKWTTCSFEYFICLIYKRYY